MHTSREVATPVAAAVRVLRPAAALAAVLLLAGNGPAADAQFGIRTASGEWRALHDAASPHERWRPRDVLPEAAIGWEGIATGIERAELTIGAGDRGWQGAVVVVRADPTRLNFALRHETRGGGTLGDWSSDRLSPDAALGMNTGYFDGGLPWGWLVLDGAERRPPGLGPLSSAVVFDRSGGVRLVPWTHIAFERHTAGVAWAFQSYPTLLEGDGEVPVALREAGGGIDLAHRDIRLAWGQLRDGRVLIVMTRFADAAGISLPFGPTIPELAALLGALGAERGVALDGGLSAQLAIRETGGRVRAWASPRLVPLALEATPRAP